MVVYLLAVASEKSQYLTGNSSSTSYEIGVSDEEASGSGNATDGITESFSASYERKALYPNQKQQQPPQNYGAQQYMNRQYYGPQHGGQYNYNPQYHGNQKYNPQQRQSTGVNPSIHQSNLHQSRHLTGPSMQQQFSQQPLFQKESGHIFPRHAHNPQQQQQQTVYTPQYSQEEGFSIFQYILFCVCSIYSYFLF